MLTKGVSGKVVLLVTYCIKNHNYWSNSNNILRRWNFISFTQSFFGEMWSSTASQIKTGLYIRVAIRENFKSDGNALRSNEAFFKHFE